MSDVSTNSSRRGFTLIEVMISVLILALGLLGLGAVIPVIVSQQRKAADSTLSVSCLSGAFAAMDGRGKYIAGVEQPLWAHWLYNSDWSPSGEWEVGENRQSSNNIIPWSGPQPLQFEYRAVVNAEYELLPDSGDARWQLSIQRQRRTIGPPPGTWQNDGPLVESSELLRALDRLYPTREAAGAGARPGLVWDMAARAVIDARQPTRDSSREIIVALFGRRVDPGIRVPSGQTVYSVIGAGAAVPVAVNASGLPSLNGAGNYSRPIVVEGERADTYLRTRVQLNNVGAIERQLATRTGQQLVDEFGAVYTVVSYDQMSGVVVLDRPVSWSMNQQVGLVFAPEIPVHVSVRRITVPY